jgi:hypothetical protein
MMNKDGRRNLLSKYQKRILREYEELLEVASLNPERVLDFAEDDVDAVVPILRSMTDQVIRSDVVFEYTMIDMELDSILFNHFFGHGKKLTAARRTHRYKTLRLMLQNLYILQKLAIIRDFKDVPKGIVSKIAAVNDLRNGLAHTFFTRDLSPSKRTYNGLNIFSLRGELSEGMCGRFDASSCHGSGTSFPKGHNIQIDTVGGVRAHFGIAIVKMPLGYNSSRTFQDGKANGDPTRRCGK